MDYLGSALVGLVFCLGCASRQPAGEPWGPAPVLATAAPSTTGSAQEDREPWKRHTLSILTRVVSEERAKGGVAVGLDYEYRLREKWGVGAFAEYVTGDFEVGVFGIMAYYHPIEPLGIGIGPGWEYSKEEQRWLARFGGFYEFEAGEIIIAPALYVDWIEGDSVAVLAGINFGKKF